MQLSGIAKTDFQIVGRLLVNRDPSLALELLTSFPRAHETDLNKIPIYFSSFCQLQGIETDQLTGPHLLRKHIELQRLFICVILKLYIPYVFHLDLKNQRTFKGLAKNIALTIRQDASNVSKMMRQSIVLEKAYDDFRDKTEAIIETIYHGQA